MVTSESGHSDVVKLLLQAGADIGLQFKVSVRVYYLSFMGTRLLKRHSLRVVETYINTTTVSL